MRFFWSLLTFVLLFAIILTSSYFIYDNWPREAVPIRPNLPSSNIAYKNEQINYTESKQFYNNLRFASTDIDYNFDPGCSDEKIGQVQEAFREIENFSQLRFYENKEKSELEVTCSELAPDPDIKDHFIAGEGGPIEVLNGSVYAVISKGKISLYREDTCSSPHIALHELLHVLGFDHNKNPRSILYPTLDCNQVLDSYFIDKINQLYSAPSKPDFAFLSAEGNRTGKYVSFEIVIENQGLAKANSFSLRAVADGNNIKDFDLGILDIATRKILTVSNLNVGRTAKEIKLVVDPDNKVDELNEDNNELILSD